MKHARIIAVEDERIVALHLKQQLIKLGFEVAAVAASGETALRDIAEFLPDLVLMDIHIEGDIDGIETAARIPSELGIPVIYLTAYSEEATLERARATRPYGYLIKPYSERELYATIQMALERRDVEAALRASEDRFRSIFGVISEGIFIVDIASGLITEVNEPGCVMFGYAPGELVGKNIEVLSAGVSPHTSAEAALQIKQAAASVAPHRFDWRCRTKSGQLFWAELSLQSAAIGGERVVLSIIRDLTERQAIEEQLRQAQKMEAVGQLTGGIAHDFNNLLGVIIGNLDLLREALPDDAELADLSGEALTAALGGAELTRRLLAFARRQPLQPERIELNGLVGDTAKLLRRVLGDNIEVQLTASDKACIVSADRIQLEAALTNLATNARDAMPRGGRLMISIGRRRLDEDYAAAHSDVSPGDYAMIEVTDTGVGMTAEVAERIFEPFYTTKGRDRGTGLGLSMVFGFLKQSGGHVSVYSEVDIGTTFRLYLPLATGADSAHVQPKPPTAAEKSLGETVLVVEDNDSLRSVAVRQLKELGYRVLTARDSAEAMAVCEREQADVLFTDVVLPGDLDGMELAKRIQSRRPSVRVLLTSGFPQTRLADSQTLGGFRLLSKPYRKDELARMLGELLGGARSRPG